jgi:glyoxylase-like metal-dependent hydrolase (beta-lactamase superfamily II)
MHASIVPLSEGVFTIGRDKVFHPFDPLKDVLNDRATGSLLVEVQPFAIRYGHEVVLIDTGLGFNLPDGSFQLHSTLLENGIHPNEITHVLLSHLHKDHAGGMGILGADGQRRAAFPNATYYVSKKEFDFAIEKGSPSYIPSDFMWLANYSDVVWLNETGVVDEWISYETLGGHCPYHLGFTFHHPDGVFYFGGDVTPQYRQLKTKYVAKYDYDGQHSMQQRQRLFQLGTEAHWTFLFYHDVQQPLAVL